MSCRAQEIQRETRSNCRCPPSYHGARCQVQDFRAEADDAEGENEGVTWVLVLVFTAVAFVIVLAAGCIAYVVMRRKQ